MNPRAFRREFQAFQRCWSSSALQEIAETSRRAINRPVRRGGERREQWCSWLAFGQAEADDFARFAQEQWIQWRQSPSADRLSDGVEAIEEALWRTPLQAAESLWRRMSQMLDSPAARGAGTGREAHRLVAAPTPRAFPSLYSALGAHGEGLRIRVQWLLWERLTRRLADEEEFAVVRERLLLQLDQGCRSEWPDFIARHWSDYGRQARAGLLRTLLQPPREVVSTAREEDRRRLVALFARLATELQDASLWQEALYTARGIGDPCYAAEALADCAVTAAATGWEDPQALYESARKQLGRLRQSFDVVVQIHSLEAHRHVAHSLALIGAVEGSLDWIRRALRQAESMSSGPTRARTVADCAETLEWLNTGEAGRLLKRTLAWWQRDDHAHQAIPQMAEALVSLGHRQDQEEWIREGLQAVHTLRSPQRCEGLARCASKLSDLDPQQGERLFAWAAQLALEEAYEHLRSMALREVLPRWAAAGRRLDREGWLRTALDLSQQVTVPGIRSEVLALILQEWARRRPTSRAWLAEGEALRRQLAHPRDALPTECAYALACLSFDAQEGHRRLEEAFRRALRLAPQVEHRDDVLRQCGRALLETPVEMFIEWFPRLWQALLPFQVSAPFLGLWRGPLRLQTENLEWPVEVVGSTIRALETRLIESAHQQELQRTRERIWRARWDQA